MSVLILHLSDMHIEADTDPIIQRFKAISSVLNSRLFSASAVYIVVSGDIAQDGLKAQYDIALRFFNAVAKEIKSQKNGLSVEFVITPGNHDCDFTTDQSVRNSILKDIPNHVGSMPSSLIDVTTNVQENYFNFRNSLVSQNTIIQNDRLWSVQEFSAEGKSIWFDSLNASWMSSKSEKPGVVFFPFESYSDFKPSDADLRIAVIHHPLNWFNQVNYQAFRSFLQSLEDIVISGHEHAGNAGVRSEARGGECAYIEGCALQGKDRQPSEFNLVELNLDTEQFSCEQFQLKGDRYNSNGQGPWLPMRSLPTRVKPELQLTETFEKILNDPGATLHHPDKKNLCLEDFYVFPDLDAFDGKTRVRKIASIAKKKSAKTLALIDTLEPSIILEGDENSGKTRLLYRLFRSYHSQNLLPVYIDGHRIKSSIPEDLHKMLVKAIIEQYGENNLAPFEQASVERKIILIDDFDKTPLQSQYKDRLHKFIDEGFCIRILTVGENFEFGELIAAEQLSHLAMYTHYKILPFGYERRGELVKKWNRIGLTEVTTNDQWLLACSMAEKLIEGARLQHVATTVPIMVLSLLQISSSGVTKEMHNSSFAHYFYFLIVGALESAGVKPDGLSKYLGFATHLSWFIKLNGNDLEITEEQFKEFCRDYSAKWTSSDPKEMLETLCRARILDNPNDAICFTYQYSYYYFLGRYSNSFINTEEVKSYLAYCIQNLYVRECANTLLFLAHHSDNSFVLDGVITALANHFPDAAPATFSKEDVAKVTSLMANAPTIIYRQKNPVAHRDDVNKFKDANDFDGDGLLSAPKPTGERRDLVEEVTSLSKTMEIAGVLLTNHFSSLTRERKNSAIGHIFEGGLKLIRDFYDFIERDPDRIVKEITERSQSKIRGLTTTQAEAEARHAIAWLVKIVSVSWIEKAGTHVTSADLRDNVAEVIAASPSLALRLIEISQRLDGPGRLPQASMKAIIKTEHDNPCVMSVLQLLVLKRLYMYDTDHDDKDWAISTFQLGAASNRIELTRNHLIKHRT